MHELGIATAILDRAQRAAQQHPGAAIRRVGVRVGELSGVDPDALAFSFTTLVKDSPWEQVALEIERRRRVQRCGKCAHEFETDSFLTACPRCGSVHTECIAGDELDVVFVELEEAPCG